MINLNNLEASTKQEYREDLVSSLETAAKKLQDLVSQDSYMTQAIEKVLQYDGKTIMVDLGRDITNGNSQKGLTIRIYNGENVSNPN